MIFGSVSGNRAHIESDVDISLSFWRSMNALVGLRESELSFRYSWLLLSYSLQRLRRKNLWCVFGKDRIGLMFRLEALLSCRSVYGSPADVEQRQEAATISMMALNGLILFAQVVEKLKNQVVNLKTCEVFAYSTSLIASQNCLCMGFNLPCAKGRSSGVHWRAQKGRLRAMLVPFTLEHGVLMQTMSVIY